MTNTSDLLPRSDRRLCSEEDRIEAARRLLLGLAVGTDDPRWSSAVLGSVVDNVMKMADGNVGDLLNAAAMLFAEQRSELSPSVANFIRDFVVACLTAQRGTYDLLAWHRFIDRLGCQPTKAQLYLAMHALPDRYLSDELRCKILEALDETPFREEASSMLAV